MATRNAAPKSKSWSDRLDRLASRGRANTEKGKEEEKTRQLAINAAATLQLVGANVAVVERVANEILDRRLTDDSSGGTVDTLVGEAMIETITGNPAPAFLPRAGEVARALIDAQANLQLVGIDDTDEARTLTDRIVREGLRGAGAKAAVREVVGPVVKQVEADQQGGSAPTAPAETATKEPRQPAAPAPQDLLRTKAPAGSGTTSPPAGGTEAAPPATTPAARASTPATTTPPSPNTPAPAEAAQSSGQPARSNEGTGRGNSDPAPGVLAPEPTGSITTQDDGDRLILTQRDASGAVVSTTIIISMGDGRESVVVKDGEGNVVDAYVQNGPKETMVSAQRGGGGTAESSAPAQENEGKDGSVDDDNDGSDDNSDDDDNNDGDGDGDDGDGDDDGDATGNGDDDSQNQGGDDGSTTNESSEDQPAASGTPNPEREEAGSGFGLQEATGGRLGGDAARRQQDRLDLLGRGGGAAGPEAGENPASGVLLTPEERANASRLLGVKAGGSVTTPSPLKEGGTAITERDLKDLVLRGNGGAGTPEVTVFPVLQPPQSPLAPPAGVPGVGGDPITGLGSTGNLRALPNFQRPGAFQRSEGLRGKVAPPANTSALPLGPAGAELGLVAPHLFGTQAGGLVGAEIRFGGLAAFQAAPLLA